MNGNGLWACASDCRPFIACKFSTISISTQNGREKGKCWWKTKLKKKKKGSLVEHASDETAIYLCSSFHHKISLLLSSIFIWLSSVKEYWHFFVHIINLRTWLLAILVNIFFVVEAEGGCDFSPCTFTAPLCNQVNIECNGTLELNDWKEADKTVCFRIDGELFFLH